LRSQGRFSYSGRDAIEWLLLEWLTGCLRTCKTLLATPKSTQPSILPG